MIIHLKKSIEEIQAVKLAEQTKAAYFKNNEQYVLITSSGDKELPEALASAADEYFVMDSDIQLASKKYRKDVREIQVGKNVQLGGNHNNTLLITGPCSIESKEQITQSANLLKELNITTLRAGCFKPRTSPYSFQGLGMEGLRMLAEVREEYGLNIITEVRDATHVDAVIEYADIVQVGSKAMYDQGILRRCGKANKPVLLKRHFGATLQEFVQAAEFILSGGNEQVMLCERGIRTFETKTRFSLDLCGVSYLKEHTNLPVVLDPSHAMGIAYGIPDLTRASVAMGVDGLLIETHPTPKQAKSDAAQQLNHDEFRTMYRSLEPIAAAIGRKIV
ncbi:3-deoxy-7-phosphoheptulonate synthase [Porifericola rhodea]|uniref:3-deoxy-7-phosphoheptulonate synthase n=1 Tax=Porifericola rhodea TaxID=930972 RepID=UPI0026652FF1|nr:3-deoxy-7-phosphoheptulonate synthase [Porifericola rhodea]WKN31826.1 3-deoxy-7-phosphoheptulonate synthase [Porifericola rhodea]